MIYTYIDTRYMYGAPGHTVTTREAAVQLLEAQTAPVGQRQTGAEKLSPGPSPPFPAIGAEGRQSRAAPFPPAGRGPANGRGAGAGRLPLTGATGGQAGPDGGGAG